VWDEPPKQPAEGIVARRTTFQGEEFSQEFHTFFGKLSPVDAGSATTQERAQSDHQHFMKIMLAGIAPARIVQFAKARLEPVHLVLPTPESVRRIEANPLQRASFFRMRFP
jgi:hypothetical protein